MLFCAACGIAAVSCYEEQSNSSDIVTHQPENNNQQMHHSSYKEGCHFRLKESKKKEKKKRVELYHKSISLVNERTYCTELQAFSYRML